MKSVKENPLIAVPGKESQVQNYLRALRNLGAEPVLVTKVCEADEFDGLLLPGGVDIEPWRYHQEPDGCGETDAELDALQFAVLDRFIDARKPVFGICRGHQLINVAFGGTLIQDIDCADRHAHGPGSSKDKVHLTQADANRFVADLYGTEVYTNSSHHQAVGRLGKGLSIVQRSKEGIAEALYHVVLPIWSVQWHPERMCFDFSRGDTVDGSRVLAFFLDKCRQEVRMQM